MDSPPPVTLPRTLVTQLLGLAQQGGGREVCGLIGIHRSGALSCYPVANIASLPERRFVMEPGGQIAALRRMREHGEELFAIFHSHPSSPPVPSAADIEEGGYPEALYLIISLDIKGVLEMRGFKIEDAQAREVSLEIG